MLLWCIGVFLAVAIFVLLFNQVSQRTCESAYFQGINDASTLTWNDIAQKFESFLKPPMVPLSAAAYKRGLEYLLTNGLTDWPTMKSDFLSAYKSGAITKEGRILGLQGPDAAIDNLRLRIAPDIEKLLLQQPDMPPFLAAVMIKHQI